jgi:hypothetical protein
MILIGVYFRRLKINHDSHEFILESGTVANNTYALYQVKITIKQQKPCHHLAEVLLQTGIKCDEQSNNKFVLNEVITIIKTKGKKGRLVVLS